MAHFPDMARWAGVLVVCAGTGWLARRLADAYAELLRDSVSADARALLRALRNAAHRARCTAVDASGALVCLGAGAGCLHGTGWLGVWLALGCLVLYVLAWLDVRSGLLPDALTLPLGLLGIALGPLGWRTAGLAGLLVWALAAGGARLYLWRRGHEGFGGGDIKLLAALAAWVGLQPIAWVLLVACLSGLAWAMLVQRRWRPYGAYPFGPFLALAATPVLMSWPAVQSWS